MSKIEVEIDDTFGLLEVRSEEDFLKAKEVVDAYHQTILETGREFADANGSKPPPSNFDLDGTESIEIYDKGETRCNINWEEYIGCGEYETFGCDFPIRYIWEDRDKWAEELRQEKIRKNIEAVQKRQEKERKEKLEKDARDYKSFLELKERFKDVDFSANSDIMGHTGDVNTLKTEGGT